MSDEGRRGTGNHTCGKDYTRTMSTTPHEDHLVLTPVHLLQRIKVPYAQSHISAQRLQTRNKAVFEHTEVIDDDVVDPPHVGHAVERVRWEEHADLRTDTHRRTQLYRRSSVRLRWTYEELSHAVSYYNSASSFRSSGA